jgi:predicted phosphodiesterase
MSQCHYNFGLKDTMLRNGNFQLAVISDIHGNRWALEAVLNDIKQREIKHIVNLGDCFYGPLDPLGTAQILVGLDIPTVRGNEDRIIVETPVGNEISPTLQYVRKSLKPKHLQWLKRLKMTDVVYENFFLCHGSPKRDDEYLLVNVLETGIVQRKPGELTAALSGSSQDPLYPQVFLCGHDHVPCAVYLAERRLIVNPGSVGLPAYTDDLPYFHAREAGTPHARYSIISRSGDKWKVEDISIAYQWELAAKMAIQNDRPDWAKWLQTGCA